MKTLIPHFIQTQIVAGQVQGECKAYTMFIDLSGFTALTETLMKRGSEGAEQLSHILNDIFQPLVHLVYQQGGFIPHFAGDAFTAIFSDKGDPNALQQLLDTALQARDFMQSANERKAFGDFHIGIKTGIAFGDVDWGIVGDEHKAYYFRGSAIDNCADSQHYAKEKEIAFDNSLVEAIKEAGYQYHNIQEGYYLLDEREPRTIASVPIVLPVLQESVVSQFLPASVMEFEGVGEFRSVIAVFLSFDGVSDHQALSQLVKTVMEQTYNFAGYFKEVDFGDKGGVIVCFFGAPVSFENNDTRALEFAVCLREELQHLGESDALRFRIGLTQGIAYTGMIGGEERCQYAVVGSSVNLAARLMLHSEWGDVLVDEEISKNKYFKFTNKGKIQYKGISEGVATYRLQARNIEEAHLFKGAMIGREAEMNQLLQFSKKILNAKHSGVAYIFGEAGIGKSRLSYELEKEMREKRDVFWITCQADQILRKPFNPLVYFFRNYFEQSSENTIAQNRELFDKGVAASFEMLNHSKHPLREQVLSEWTRTKSIIAAQIGLFEEDSLWEQLDAKGRYENTLQAFTNFFLAAAILKPVIVELEDGHWFDDSSKAFLGELIRRLEHYPVLFLVTARYTDDGRKVQLFDTLLLKNYPNLEIDLNIMQPETLRAFAEHQLGGAISESLLELLLRTTNGNPFYVEQMIAYFQESELLLQGEEGWSIKDKNIRLSNSINAVLTARIDRLSKMVRETVKAAAVIGREFEIPILTEVMRAQDEFSKYNGNVGNVLREQIQTAERWQIWRAMNELRYIFQHSLLREAVYDMQLRTRLRELHKYIGEAIEKIYADNLAERYVDLAFHYEQAGEDEKTNEYLQKAGDHARRNYQNQQAILFYDKLLVNLQASADYDAYIKILLKKGTILELIGQWGSCVDIYQEALTYAQSIKDALLLGRAHNSLGTVLMLKGDYAEAKTHLSQGADFFEQADDTLGMARSYGNMGNLYFRQGEYENAKNYFTRSIDLSRNQAQPSSDAQIAANLGLTYMNQGDFKAGIECQQEQLQLCEKTNDRRGMATLLTNMGIVYFEKGDNDEALRCFERGLALSEALGNKMLTSIAIGCIGSVYERKGDYDRAMKDFEYDLVLCKELGDKQGIAICLGLIGNLHSVRGEFEEAIKYLKKNHKYCKKLKYQKGIAKARKDLAFAFYSQNNFPKALTYYDKAIKVSRKINNRLLLAQSLIEKGRLLIDTGQYEEAKLLQLEIQDLALQLGNAEVLFQAEVLVAVIAWYNEQQVEAMGIIFGRLQKSVSLKKRATLFYELQRFYPQRKDYILQTVVLYRRLFAETPRYLYKERKERLEILL